MNKTEKEINAEILKLCEEILPKTPMRSNQKIQQLFKMVKEYLDGKN